MINKIKTNRIKSGGLPAQAGFTLIETLIAVLVLMMAISGPLTLASKGLQATLVAKDQDTAYYLAQDAIEYIRFLRDTNKLSGATDWIAGGGASSNIRSLSPCISANGLTQCRVDSLQNLQTTIVGCSGDAGGVCKPIQYDSSINNFSYTSGTASIFTRSISIMTPVGANDCMAGHGCEALITITVTWYDQGSLQRTITVKESIFNWQ